MEPDALGSLSLGAAQTFGRFCERPFPMLLSERLSLPALNISRGGAGPSFFSGSQAILDRYLNMAKFVVVQITAARSEGSSMFASDGLNYLQDPRSGAYVGSDEAFADLIREQPPGTVARIVAETRAAWRASYRQLLHRIQVPKILLWFSTRWPAYRERFDSVQRLFGSFPQLVDAESVKVITPWADAYVEVVGARGLPQPLVDRFTGATTTVLDPWTRVAWTENWYYPSPAMHAAAAAALEPVCRRLPGVGGAGSEQTARLSGVRRWLGPLVRYPL